MTRLYVHAHSVEDNTPILHHTILVMMGITIVALAMAQSISRTLHLFLINLLLARLFMTLGDYEVFIVGTSAVLVVVSSEQHRPPLYLCRVFLWIYAVGAVARLWNFVALSLSVLAIVRFGKKTISLLYAAVIITILWIIPIGMGLYILLPYMFETQFACPGCSLFP